MWQSTQSGRWCEESLFLDWKGREALIWTLWCSGKMGRYSIARTELLNTSGSTSQGTDSFRVQPITPGHPIPQISTPSDYFLWGYLKDRVYETIHRQQRFSKRTSEEKSDRFHETCSVELWTILMFELLRVQHGAWIEYIINY